MKGKILVVDDEPDVLNLAKIILMKAGFQVVTANNGDDCLQRVDSLEPDLILLDSIMPGKNGIEVCRTLKSQLNTQKIPIVIFSASSSMNNKSAALEAGADGFLSKPFTIKELTDIITKHYDLINRINK
jgi:CheY-like chemotaxis protein